MKPKVTDRPRTIDEIVTIDETEMMHVPLLVGKVKILDFMVS